MIEKNFQSVETVDLFSVGFRFVFGSFSIRFRFVFDLFLVHFGWFSFFCRFFLGNLTYWWSRKLSNLFQPIAQAEWTWLVITLPLLLDERVFSISTAISRQGHQGKNKQTRKQTKNESILWPPSYERDNSTKSAWTCIHTFLYIIWIFNLKRSLW